jgi:hypothetical protein
MMILIMTRRGEEEVYIFEKKRWRMRMIDDTVILMIVYNLYSNMMMIT